MSELWQQRLEYGELRIVLPSLRGASPATVRFTSPTGATGECKFRLSVGRDAIEQALASVAEATNQTRRRSVPRDAVDPVKDLGARLFTDLFSGDLGSEYQRATTMAEQNGTGLRVRLVMADLETVGIPWEFLYDVVRQDFVALSGRSALVRRLGDDPDAPQTTPVPLPLRVLVAVAEVYPMGAQAEIDLLRKLQDTPPGSPGGPPLVRLEVLRDATPRRLREYVAGFSPHVVHFIGTGREPSGETRPFEQVLVLLRDADRMEGPGQKSSGKQESWESLGGSELQDVLRTAPDLRLVYFSACYTDALAAHASGVAAAAIGVRGLTTDQVCLAFVEGMYRALLEGHAIEEAVKQGRQTVDLKYPGGRQWGLVTCYLRARDGKLLMPPQAAPPAMAAASSYGVPAASADPARQRDWQRVQALLELERLNLAALRDRQVRYTNLAQQVGVLDADAPEIRLAEERIGALEEQQRHLSG